MDFFRDMKKIERGSSKNNSGKKNLYFRLSAMAWFFLGVGFWVVSTKQLLTSVLEGAM